MDKRVLAKARKKRKELAAAGFIKPTASCCVCYGE